MTRTEWLRQAIRGIHEADDSDVLSVIYVRALVNTLLEEVNAKDTVPVTSGNSGRTTSNSRIVTGNKRPTKAERLAKAQRQREEEENYEEESRSQADGDQSDIAS